MIIEVHPEELLDREQRGELSAREQELLAAHLARCVPCRLERRLRADFARDQAQPLPASDLTDVIAGALRACELPAAASAVVDVEAAAPKGSGAGRLWRRAAVLVAACAVLILSVGYAGAQLGLSEGRIAALLERVGVRVSTRPRVQTPRLGAASAAQRAAARPDSVAAALPAPSSPRSELVEAPRAAAPMLAPAPAKRHARRPAHRVGGAAAQLSAPAQRETATASTPSLEAVAPAPQSTSAMVSVSTQATEDQVGTTRFASEAPVPAPESASRLFVRASRARHRGASQEASALYDELRARFPESPEAHLSIAVSARMLLDQGELRAALAGYETYLAGADRALHEEAMVGRVRALERLGRDRDARAAAAALLRAHPRSAFRAEAEALIAESD